MSGYRPLSAAPGLPIGKGPLHIRRVLREQHLGVTALAENQGACSAPVAHKEMEWGDWNPEGPIGQIVRTTAESQKIVAARPLYFLQHRVRAKSSARDLPQ